MRPGLSKLRVELCKGNENKTMTKKRGKNMKGKRCDTEATLERMENYQENEWADKLKIRK